MKILHIDIETAPNKVYTWGLYNQNVGLDQIVEPGYTLCWAARWDDDAEVIFRSLHHHGEYSMIVKAWELINEADVVVHYNGNNFDIPTLNREFVKLGLVPPEGYHQVDLLKVVRSRFRFASNKLDFVAQQLGLGAKTAHKGMQLWNQCMAGDGRAWKTMERYNKQDVRLLRKLYKKLLPWIDKHPNHALYMDTDRPVCPNCGSKHVVKVGSQVNTRTQSYDRYRCRSCGTPIRARFTTVPKEKRKHILIQEAP